MKVGDVYICRTEGDLSNPVHSCRKGDPVVIEHVYNPAVTQLSSVDGRKHLIVCSGMFISQVDESITHHSFRACDLRKITPKDVC